MMRWDGTLLGAQELCAWANEGLHPFDEPCAEYNHLGPDNTLQVVVETDHGPLGLEPWDLVYRTDDALGVERAKTSYDSVIGLRSREENMDEDDERDRVIGVVIEVIYAVDTDMPAQRREQLAGAIVDRFTCTECGFVEMFEGNHHGECNDCAPRLAARNRAT
jgi:hypothetical protein